MIHLINVNTLKLEEFRGSVPPYAILSHTWGADHEELSFREITRKNLNKEDLPFKVAKCCEQAEKDGLTYAWVDTCCIDKTNLTELSEAIVSMFQWYKKAAVCYAYLADVTMEDNYFPLTQFCSCRWFQRGWTLQELLAPDNLHFFDSVWHDIGTKANKSNIIDRKIGIPRRFLQGTPLSEASVAQRMSWASKRVTKQEEDIAYCLLGIFNVNMPMIYGEGGVQAFIRLQEMIMRNSRDESLLAWGLYNSNHHPAFPTNTTLSAGVLAASPADFEGCQNIVPRLREISSPSTFQIQGGFVRANLSLHRNENGFLGLLNCGPTNSNTVVAIPLLKTPSGGFIRPQGNYARVYRAMITKAPAQPIYILIERHIETPTTASHRNYFYIEDPIEIGLEMIEVEPPDRWCKDRSFITTYSDPTDHDVQQTWIRFRSEIEGSSDFLVLLEFETEGSKVLTRCHVMVSSRSTSLVDLARRANCIREDAFGKSDASNGTLNIEASVERDSMQELFVVKLAATMNPPEITVDATFELEVLMLKLELESVMSDEHDLRFEAENFDRHKGEVTSSLSTAKARLFMIEMRIEKLNQQKARILDIVSRASEDMGKTSTRAEDISQRETVLSERRRSLVGNLDSRQQSVLQAGYGLIVNNSTLERMVPCRSFQTTGAYFARLGAVTEHVRQDQTEIEDHDDIMSELQPLSKPDPDDKRRFSRFDDMKGSLTHILSNMRKNR